MTEKSSCCVPFCRRRSARFPGEWMCGDHWKLVPRRLKLLRTRRRREIARLIERYDALTEAAQVRLRALCEETQDWSHDAPEVWRNVHKSLNARDRYRRFEAAIWRRMKKAAIERATGL